jgi:hypothetical protein
MRENDREQRLSAPLQRSVLERANSKPSTSDSANGLRLILVYCQIGLSMGFLDDLSCDSCLE